MTDHLAIIAASSITLDIVITSAGISVYTLSKTMSLLAHATIQKWKAGAGERLKYVHANLPAKKNPEAQEGLCNAPMVMNGATDVFWFLISNIDELKPSN